MTNEAWQVPYSRRVDSITNYQHTFSEEDYLVVESSFEEFSDFSVEKIERNKQIALSDPIIAGNLVTYDGKATGVNITINLQVLIRLKKCQRLLAIILYYDK